MRTFWHALAALSIAAPVPVAAQTMTGLQLSVRSGSGHHGGGGFGNHGGFDRRDGRRHRGDSVIYYDGYREYQGDTTWQSDSFNDWWHDRPDRAYPRWVGSNQNCERRWFAGDTLRC